MAKSIAFLGTGSDVGKSIITAGFTRILSNLGYKVCPFKAQNMSNNSWVTIEGGEMGRAQIVQALAARVEPHVDMNPVLLKPSSDQGSQVVIQGKVYANKNARDYYKVSEYCAEKAFESFRRLNDQYDYICIEGAGSCAEMNLKDRDFVNFRTAIYAQAPVILVADIDRGGVFAQIIGTLNILPENEKKMVKAVIVNRFRGDKTLFYDGKKYIEDQCNIPVLGIIPHLYNLEIDAEDSLPLHAIMDPVKPPDKESLSIAVIYLRHISNHTDINALSRIPNVIVHFLSKPRDLSNYDCVILPGTKNVCADLLFLEESQWKERILDFKGKIVGICGGYQMLGEDILDPYGVEGEVGGKKGLNLLKVKTVLEKSKRLTRIKGWCHQFQAPVEGYEIHMGVTENFENQSFIEVATIGNQSDCFDDGSITDDQRIFGTYMHGIFDSGEFLKKFLEWINNKKALKIIEGQQISFNYSIDKELDRLANNILDCIDNKKFISILDKGLGN